MSNENEGQDQQAFVSLAGIEHIRRAIHNGQEYWSVVDVVGFLTGAPNPSEYWNTIRTRMRSEGAQETLSQIIELPMRSADGRHRKTDTMTRPTLLRFVQSIASPKAEPLKLFLAQAGDEYLTQRELQAESLDEMRSHYRKLGRGEDWITARIIYLATRNVWTSEIQARGVGESQTIARLTSPLESAYFWAHDSATQSDQRHAIEAESRGS